MSDRTVDDRAAGRLFVLGAVVLAMVLALLGRLWFLQVASGSKYVALAFDNATREIVTPATRGLLLDDRGLPLVDNETAQVVTVDRTKLERLGKVRREEVLDRLSPIVQKDAAEIWREVQVCGPGVPQPCWRGGQYQPVPVASFSTESKGATVVDPDLLNRRVLAIQEHAEDFPGIAVELQAVRDYPQAGVTGGTTLAAHLLGYLSPLIKEDKAKAAYAHLSDASQVGRGGLEETYDLPLRGSDGVTTVAVNRLGQVARTVSETEPVAGNDVVLNLDVTIQRAAEQALQNALTKYAPHYNKKPTNASAVVMTTDGRIVAIASTPSFDPGAFIGGISSQDYQRLNDKKSGLPLVNRAVDGAYAPGSTWKPMVAAGLLKAGLVGQGGYTPCPPKLTVGNQDFRNFEGESFGAMTLHTALVVSCDTVFYRYAYDEWVRDGGLKETPAKRAVKAKEVLVQAAKAYGFGTRTGIDLPGEVKGTIVDRATRSAQYALSKSDYCAGAKTRPQGSYLQRLDAENCVDGYLYRGGDAVQFAIGQGSNILVTPLQLARAYAAIANGGTLWQPRLAKAVVRPDGTVVQQVAPISAGRVPTSASDLAYLRDALHGVTHDAHGTAAGVFGSYPIQVSGKTGTAETSTYVNDVETKHDTSWFASFAPSDKPQYVVVVSVPESDQGARVAAPAVRDIYDRIFGVKDGVLDPAAAAHRGGHPPESLPCFNQRTGQVDPPSKTCATVGATNSVTPSTPSAAASPAGAPASSGGRALGLPEGLTPDRRRR